MIKTSIEKLAYDIGFDIGNSDDITQGLLLNGFSKGLCASMNDNVLNTQLCYIAQKLDKNSKKIIKELFEFIKLDEESEVIK
jgi:hypothetical protein